MDSRFAERQSNLSLGINHIMAHKDCRMPTCLWGANRGLGNPAVLSALDRRASRANLDSTTERWGLKSENRNPKPETNPKPQQGNDQNYAAAAGFEHRAIGNLNLFRVSAFGFRISQPWSHFVSLNTRRADLGLPQFDLPPAEPVFSPNPVAMSAFAPQMWPDRNDTMGSELQTTKS